MVALFLEFNLLNLSLMVISLYTYNIIYILDIIVFIIFIYVLSLTMLYHNENN